MCPLILHNSHIFIHVQARTKLQNQWGWEVTRVLTKTKGQRNQNKQQAMKVHKALNGGRSRISSGASCVGTSISDHRQALPFSALATIHRFAKVVVQSVSEVSDFGLSKVATSRCNNVTHSWVNLKKDNAFKNSFIFQTHLRGKLWFFHLQ